MNGERFAGFTRRDNTLTNFNNAGPQTLRSFVTAPEPAYVPLSHVSFGHPQYVMPAPQPPARMVFSNPTFDKIQNIPGQNLYAFFKFLRTGRQQV